MPGRNGTVSGAEYRYAFNGMETDKEVSGGGNSYTTQFRQYDPRLGRWKSLDPVVHYNLSPYNAFDNNPIVIIDPLGADGIGELVNGEWQVTATIYVHFDDPNMTPEQKQLYLDKMKYNIISTWSTFMYQGYPLNLDNVNILEVDNVPDKLEENENIIVVGNGTSKYYADNYGDMPYSDYYINNKISFIDDNALNNSGYFFLANGADEAAHEFGHILGLSDRYQAGVIYKTKDYDSYKNELGEGRYTVPIRVRNVQTIKLI